TAIALGASVGNYLLKSVTRFRHLLWVSALVMSLALPMVSAVFSMKGVSAPVATPPVKVSEAVINVPECCLDRFASEDPSVCSKRKRGSANGDRNCDQLLRVVRISQRGAAQGLDEN